MRRLIFSTAILIFAINGIACACPTDFSAPDHTSHQMHGDTGQDNPGDCCDDCGNISAVQQNAEQTLFAPENFKQTDFSVINPFVYEVAWDKAHELQRSNVYRDKPTSLSTPVIFFDRMLD